MLSSSVIILIILFVLYNILVIKFSSKILVGSNNNTILKVACVIFNLSALLLGMKHVEYTSFVFLLIWVAIIVEFKIISKATFKQVVFGASTFLFHIVSIYVPVLIGYSLAKNVYIYSVFDDISMRSEAISYTIILLAIALLVFNVFIKIKYVVEISTSNECSWMVGIGGTVSSFTIIVLSEFLFLEDSSRTQFIFALTVSLILGIVFYYMLLYGISFIKMNKLKRENDWIEKEYIKVLEKRKAVSDILSRDVLTNLYNKKFIEETLNILCDQKEASFALLFIDINGLKYVNDTYGHEVGDQLICAVANGLKISVRESDYVGRMSGDEFIVIITDINGEDLERLKNRINYNIKGEWVDKPFEVSSGIGGIIVTNDMRSLGANHLIEIVDKLMREDKELYYSRLEGMNI